MTGKKLFIIGANANTDTSNISALIVKKMRDSSYNCGYFKPLLPNVTTICNKLVDSNVNKVLQKTNISSLPEECTSYFWQNDSLPYLLAKSKNQEIDIEKIKYDYNQICKKYNYILIEGTYGITCPLKINKDEKYLLKDLVWELGLSIIVVTKAGNDAINSTLLTIDYARGNGIEIEGIILSDYESNNIEHWESLELIETLTKTNVVATVSSGANDIMLLEGLFKE